MKSEKVKISEVKPNPNNPRLIKDDKFAKLVDSLRNFPEMAEVRPIVVNTDMIILGGNMRFRAMKEAGWKTVPVQVVDWPEDKQREFIIKDNVSGGEWDWEMLANEWDVVQLNDWGIEVPDFVTEKEKDIEEIKNQYTSKINAPTYEPKNEKPKTEQLYDKEKAIQLIKQLEHLDITEEEREFLRYAAYRHIIFNYELIADFYAHSKKEVQEVMENSALVIIDFNKAIENGFVKMVKELTDIYLQDYGDEE